jgi:hypothetical protein
MKSPSKELFDLIQSLSKGERIFFRKYSTVYTAGKDNKYMQLFEGIEKQGEYDEAKLVKANKNIAYGTQLSVTKNYLYNQLLDSIPTHHRSVNIELRNQINRVEFLFDKGLYNQSLKELKKAKQYARTYELYHSLCELFQYWELPLALRTQDMDLLKNSLKEWRDEIKRQDNIQAYVDLSFQLALIHSQQGMAREKVHQQKLKEIVSNVLMKNESRAITFTSRIMFHNINGIYWETIGNIGKKYKHFRRVIELFDEHPEKIKIKTLNYVARMNNYLLAISDMKRYGEMQACLNKMEESAHLAVTKLEKTRHFYYYYSNLLHYYFVTGNFSASIAAIPTITGEIKKHQNSLTIVEKTLLFVNISNVFFCARNYRQCIYWLNKIRNEMHTKNFPDVQATIHLLFLILHYEAGSGENLLASLIKSDKNFFSKRKRLYKFENVLLTFFKKNMAAKSSKAGLKEEYIQLKKQMTELSKDPFEKNAFRYFDFFLWVDSKIENRPIEEIAREKAGI